MKLKRYLKNLWVALTGRNPYEVELEKEGQLRKDAEAAVKSNNAEVGRLLGDRTRAEKQVMAYQNLTENLRQRIVDKDIELEAQSQRYSDAVTAMRGQHRLQREELEEKNRNLRDDLDATLEQLQRVNKDIGREMKNTNLLAKTNNALNDLCQAMASEDAEKMLAAVAYLDWSNILSQIAQQYLIVFRRKQELEERICGES